MMTTSVEWVEKNGTPARGKREYLAFLRGEHLTLKQSVLANCYECTGMYTDGREDCDQGTCVFYVYMPYRKNGAVKERTLSGETKVKTVNAPRTSLKQGSPTVGNEAARIQMKEAI